MKIALLTLTRGTVSGGYAKYLAEVVPRLRLHPQVSAISVYVPPAMTKLDPGYLTWPENGWTRAVGWLRREVERERPDVVFIPSSVFVDFGPVPVVTMMRNMEPLDHPFGGNSWNERLRNMARALAARHACSRSARVIAVSDYVRDTLVRKWKIDPSKIAVVPHGVDTEVSAAKPAMLDSNEEFIFTAGSVRPARGLDDLFEALARGVARQMTVAIGGTIDDEAYRMRLMRRLAESEAGVRVIWMGKLSPGEMAWCYRHARLFVMTSRAEACPNIVLEAMANGSLSISTDQPPMPEFFGDAALYYRRRDGNDLGRALTEALQISDETKRALRSRAEERSRRFTWAATVESTFRELDFAWRSGRASGTL